ESDCVLFVDVKDMGKWTQTLDRTTRRIESLIPGDATILDAGFNELGIGAWSHDHAQLHETDVQVTTDSAVALPLLLELCRELNTAARDGWRRRLAAFHDEAWRSWAAQAQSEAGRAPGATSRRRGEGRGGWRRGAPGCGPPARRAGGRRSSGTSTASTAIRAPAWARRRRSASRSASRSRTRAAAGSSSTCSPTAT